MGGDTPTFEKFQKFMAQISMESMIAGTLRQPVVRQNSLVWEELGEGEQN